MKRVLAIMILAISLTLSACTIRIPMPDRPSLGGSGGEIIPTVSPSIPVVEPTMPEEYPMPTEPVTPEGPSEPAGPASCQHTYSDATCDVPATCSKCGQTTGDALGHNFQGGSCDTPGTCSRCGATSGTGAHNYYGSKCTVCGDKTQRYYDIQDALKRCERYPKYMKSNYELICSDQELFNMTKEAQYFTKAHKRALEVHDYLQNIINFCEDYNELHMLTDECRDLLLEMPTVPGSSTTSAMRSYISDAKLFALNASRLSVIYNVLCESYELPGV